MSIRRISKVAVIGSGIMGSGIACHFANIGVEVLLLDIAPSELTEKEKVNPLTKYWLKGDWGEGFIMVESKENDKLGLIHTSNKGVEVLPVKYDKIVPLLIEGIKEQQLEIKSLTERIKKLENK